MPKTTRTPKPTPTASADAYRHPEATNLLRPDVGTQPYFPKSKRKPPTRYRYDSSLSPELMWDGGNAARELGEWLIRCIADPKGFANPSGLEFRDARGEVVARVRTVQEAAELLAAIARPFLNWAGKAERLSFDVPTLPLFIHERLSTQAILETLTGHRRDTQLSFFDLFGDPNRPIRDQVLRAYEYPDGWTNRMILGDSLAVMNSLLEYERLGGQVQMIYMDPPYGVKFGSNFQPFVRKRDVTHNDDADMTREPEMVKAYRDTWELGLHSYLTYMRDRLLLCRDLLAPTGSIFVQISDENVHHVRELMDEVFGAENFIALIPFRKKTMPLGAKYLESIADYILWYARNIERTKYNQLYEPMSVEGDSHWNCVELADGTRRKMTRDEINNHGLLPHGSIPFQLVSLYPAGVNKSGLFAVSFRNQVYRPPDGNSWFTNLDGMERLIASNRIEPYEDGKTIRYALKLSDSPVTALTSLWADTSAPSDKIYAVQTSNKVIQRCILMTTSPGDLVVDPTCGSGTTAYVAEQWGRRWITADVSRVPLALARQRLLTATFPYFELKEEARGPAGGFVYRRKQNNRGEEIGGIVPYITKGSVAGDEPAKETVLVDRPEENGKLTRVSGPFTFEATIPTPMDWETETVILSDATSQGSRRTQESEESRQATVDPSLASRREPGRPGDPLRVTGAGASDATDHTAFTDRMLEVLRKSPLLHLGGGKTVTLHNIRPPAKTLSLSAEALVDATATGQSPSIMDAVDEAEEQSGLKLPLSRKPVAIVFGPENGAVAERQVFEAAKEASAKGYTILYVIGFAIQANARELIESCDDVVGVPAAYVQATPDLMMGDLLKNMRSSQIFSVCGLPEIQVSGIRSQESGGEPRYQVELLGLDVFDPQTMEVLHRRGDDVPAWFLDTDYNGLCFHVSQAFFPRTAAWDSLKRALKGTYEDSVWEHLAGAVSAPFEAGEHRQVAVKVIDDRGNELLVVKILQDAAKER